ncbi:MAG: alpha/beta hydrolase [Deltaproteobacteria bacterium]|nr:alpha/beta hydrolase [Deltaproteobacteria bacterium]
MNSLVDVMGPLHLVDHGGDGPPMLLIHGLGGSVENWLRVASLLARDHHVYAVDLPGFGRSPPAGRPPTLEGYVELIAALIRQRIREPAVLVGNSMGGLLSLLTASQHPELVRGAVLVNPALPRYGSAPVDRMVGTVFALYAIPGVGELYFRKVARRASTEAAIRYFFDLCGLDAKTLPPEVIDAHRAVHRYRRDLPWTDATFLGAARSLLKLVLRPSRFEEHLRRVRAPTLLMHGTRDRLVSMHNARAVAKRREDFTFAELPTQGHTPMLEEPAEFVERVLAWTAALPAPARPAASA